MNTRLKTLIATLLMAATGYALHLGWSNDSEPPRQNVALGPTPLPGKSEITELQIIRQGQNDYVARIQYYYSGDRQHATVMALATDQEAITDVYGPPPAFALRGKHTVDIPLGRPPFPVTEFVTKKVVAAIESSNSKDQTKIVDYVIEWPSVSDYLERTMEASKTSETLYQEAVALIDEGTPDALSQAKARLDQILVRGAVFVPVYAELARIAMKSNWSPTGFSQAEKYLTTALGIDPKHANSKVLLGYVYAHQKRYREAESEFAAAEKIGTSNLWLWANWGELYLMEKKNKEATEKYLRAVAGKRHYDTYDRARISAYKQLFSVLREHQDVTQLNSLYKQRAEEFGDKYACFHADYGHFRLTAYGDFDAGIANAKMAINRGCQVGDARDTLGMAYYLAWNRGTGEDKFNAINQARAFLPEGPELYYQLAKSEATVTVITDLIKNGTPLDVRNEKNFNALALALRRGDAVTARRLAKLGSKFDEPVGPEKYPVGFIAILQQDMECVKVMRDHGVNFAQLKFQGKSAVDFAREIKNKQLSALIEQGAKYSL